MVKGGVTPAAENQNPRLKYLQGSKECRDEKSSHLQRPLQAYLTQL